MKRNLLLTLTLLALLVIAYTPVFAQAPEDGDIDEEIIVVGDMGPGFEDFDIDEDVIFAGKMGHGMGPGMRMGLPRMADELELTKDQRKQLEDINFNFRKGIIPLRAQLQVLNLELHKMIRSDAPRKDVDAQIDLIGRHRSQIQKEAVGHRMAMRSSLTAEQREKCDNRPHMMKRGMRQPMKDMMMKRMREHGGRGKGL